MVPKRFPWVHTESAQPVTERSMSSGRASVVKSRSRPPAGASEPESAKMASRTDPPTK